MSSLRPSRILIGLLFTLTPLLSVAVPAPDLDRGKVQRALPFEDAVAKGRAIADGLEIEQCAGEPAQWKEEDLWTWGWTSVDPPVKVEQILETAKDVALCHITKRLRPMTHEHCMEEVRVVTVGHTDEKIINGVTYPATKGTFTIMTTFNVIMAVNQYTFSPATTSGGQTELPRLGQWPDIATIVYRNRFDPEEWPLHGVIQYMIGDAESLNVLSHVLKAGMLQKLGWPGVTFAYGSEGYFALMGLPGARDVASLLVQYADVYGWRCVDEVQIWHSPPMRPHIFYSIVEGPCKKPK